MEHNDTVHIREGQTVMSNGNGGTYCGGRGETVSYEHVVTHIFVNRDGCCRRLFQRLCDTCLDKMPKEGVKV